MEIARIIREALDIWNAPAFTSLPSEVITDCANRRIREHGLDLDLTADACFATKKSKTFTFGRTQRDRKISECDISRVIRVEARSTTSVNDDDWFEISVASYEDWSEATLRNDDIFCAFYRNIDTHMVISRDMSLYTIRLIYKVLNDCIEEMDLPSVYHSLLVYDLALEIGPIIDDRSPEFAAVRQEKMAMLASRYKEAFERVEKWRRSQRSTNTTFRRAFNDRNLGLQVRNRRFTVTIPQG